MSLCPAEVPRKHDLRPSGGLSGVLKVETILSDPDFDDITGLEFALENLLRQRIFDLLLYRTFQRPCAVDRIKAGLGELVARGL
jgi:hypothetical protein